MSLESGWKGRVATMVPPGFWRRSIELLDRKTPASDLSIAELRRVQGVAFSGSGPGSAHQLRWTGGRPQVHVGERDASALRPALMSAGWVLEPIAKDALPPGAVTGWSCATRSQTGRRRDLVEAIGVHLLVVPDGRDSAAKNVLEVAEPVDLVYTWVDGADEEWQRQRREARAMVSGNLLPTADDQARYASHDELRYSLRSAEAFLPWINHIYVVTAGQRPAWLNAEDPRITLVDHREIFADPDALPTFNSHAIESQLHRIPKLSERFLYVNDDVFFGRLLGQQVFYTPTGYPKFALTNARFDLPEAQNLPVNVAAMNNNRLLEAAFGKSAAHKFKHVAHAQLKSTLTTIAQQHPLETNRTARARFRSDTDLSIPSALAHYYGCALGAAFPAEIDYQYVDLGAEQVHLKLARLFLQERPQMFCLNEVSVHEHQHADRTSTVRQFLQHVFPWPSSFELASDGGS
ncbi:stealth family protein [Paeniglutamicibacter sp. ABSL32-1]|uniref:stealth family protein n=1 Tax=Paeniglutamicibacter quisquiliarum TaxID=2849498 RepID=UPI001C2DD360|nr:stealth family protein [Paeniglutamicibacter quisquiliarum]MBV1780780.1 stealth family protein [Paeniglutamicibacter quisquiliarum]